MQRAKALVPSKVSAVMHSHKSSVCLPSSSTHGDTLDPLHAPSDLHPWIKTKLAHPSTDWVFNSRENIFSPASDGRKNARSKIPCRIDGIATIETKRNAYGQHHSSQGQRLHSVARRPVVGICNGKYTEQQQSCPNHLKKKKKKKKIWTWRQNMPRCDDTC